VHSKTIFLEEFQDPKDMDVKRDYFSGAMRGELFDLFVGEQIGAGIGREVFHSERDPLHVIKFETRAGSFQNVLEWETWCEAQDYPDAAKWFAPCVAISSSGSILIQYKTQPLRNAHEMPDKVPSFFTDLKPSNWGMFDGRPVIHDYGYTQVFRQSMKRIRLVDNQEKKRHVKDAVKAAEPPQDGAQAPREEVRGDGQAGG
jgi:hypothetical protein